MNVGTYFRELQQMVLLNNHNDKDIKKYLEEHRQHVAAQIHRLKVLKVSHQEKVIVCTNVKLTNAQLLEELHKELTMLITTLLSILQLL